MAETTTENQGGLKDKLKNFTSRTTIELKKIGSSMAAGYSVPLDKLIKYTAFLTIGFGVLAYIIHSASLAYLYPSAWGSNVWILIFPIIAGILYFIFVQKRLEENNFDDKTHIFLILSAGLACAALFWPGVPLFILFVEICVSSDTPFWRVLTEPQPQPKAKPKTKPQLVSAPKPQTTSGAKTQAKTASGSQPRPRIKSQTQ